MFTWQAVASGGLPAFRDRITLLMCPGTGLPGTGGVSMRTVLCGWSRAILCAGIFILLLLPAVPAMAGAAPNQSEPSTPGKPEPGCSLVPTQKVQAVFGSYTQVMHTGHYLPGGEVPGVVKMFEANMMTCFFRKANGQFLQIIAYWYPSTNDAMAGFEHASKGESKGVPYFTSGSKQGPAQFFEGKGRSLGYLGQSVVIVHWLQSGAKGVGPVDVPGSRLTQIGLSVLCPNFPNCKVPPPTGP